MTGINIVYIEDYDELERIRYEYNYLQPETFYEMEDGTTFWSPDGDGGFYYDTLEEAIGQHA